MTPDRAQTAVRYDRDADGIVTLTLDDPTASANTMNELYLDSMEAAVDRLYDEQRRRAERHRRRGRQREEDLLRRRQPQAMVQATRRTPPPSSRMGEAVKAGLRRLELFPRPVVAAINGAALGGGFEICLATNHRIVVDDAQVEIGLPESTLGLLPGGGGVTRVVRLLGLQSGADGRAAARHPLQAGRTRRRRASSTSWSPPARSWCRPPRPGSRPTPTPRRTRGTRPATRCPAARPATPSWRRSCRRSRRCCASRPRARSTPRRGRSCPPRSRARRSTSTPPRGSSRAT